MLIEQQSRMDLKFSKQTKQHKPVKNNKATKAKTKNSPMKKIRDSVTLRVLNCLAQEF